MNSKGNSRLVCLKMAAAFLSAIAGGKLVEWALECRRGVLCRLQGDVGTAGKGIMIKYE